MSMENQKKPRFPMSLLFENEPTTVELTKTDLTTEKNFQGGTSEGDR